MLRSLVSSFLYLSFSLIVSALLGVACFSFLCLYTTLSFNFVTVVSAITFYVLFACIVFFPFIFKKHKNKSKEVAL